MPPRNNQHLKDLFVLDGIVNVNARDRILREIVSNTLAHRDYSGQNPLFEEGDIFRTIIPLKKIATQKVGGDNVPHSVPHDVPQGRDELIEFIKAQVRLNNKITRQAIAEGAGVSVKTIQRTLKEINNLKYVGSGNSGHWELNE